MKKVEHYVCEICGTTYNSESNAIECEQHHRKPKEVFAVKYRPKNMCADGYPDTVIIKFDDGQSIRYKRG